MQNGLACLFGNLHKGTSADAGGFIFAFEASKGFEALSYIHVSKLRYVMV